MLLQHGLLPSLGVAMQSYSRAVRLDAMDVLALLAGKGHAQPVIECGALPAVLGVLDSDPAARSRALAFLKQLAWGTPGQIVQMAQAPIVPALCRLLRTFKEYDQVLKEVYQHQEASYNFELLRGIAHMMCKMLDGAQTAAEGVGAGGNVMAAQFDMESVDQLAAVRPRHRGCCVI
jgi:hypothetical protein